MRTFYAWAAKAGHVEVSPAEELQSVLIARTLPRPAPDEALRAALAVADDRTRLAIMLAAYAGLRRAEIATLHTRQIGDGELLVVGKGGHHRRVPLHPDLETDLRAELARRRRADRPRSGQRERIRALVLYPHQASQPNRFKVTLQQVLERPLRRHRSGFAPTWRGRPVVNVGHRGPGAVHLVIGSAVGRPQDPQTGWVTNRACNDPRLFMTARLSPPPTRPFSP